MRHYAQTHRLCERIRIVCIWWIQSHSEGMLTDLNGKQPCIPARYIYKIVGNFHFIATFFAFGLDLPTNIC